MAIKQFDRRNGKKIQSLKMLILGDVELIKGKHFIEMGLFYKFALSDLAHSQSHCSERPTWLGVSGEVLVMIQIVTHRSNSSNT